MYSKKQPQEKKQTKTTNKNKPTNQNKKQCPMNEAGELRKLFGSGSV